MAQIRLAAKFAAPLAWLFLVSAGSLEDPVPYPEIEDAEPLVREQLRTARSGHDSLVTSGTSAAARGASGASGASSAALAESYGRLGELYHAYDLAEAAEASYVGAVRLEPDRFRWLYLLGFLQQTEGRRQESIETLTRALELESEDIPAILRLADQELDLGRTDAAERLYRRVLELEPTAAAALQGLGRVETAHGRHEAAVAAFEQALAITPYASHVHFLAAMAHRRSGNLERARYHFGLQGPTEINFDDPLVAGMRARATGSAVTQHRGFLAASAGLSEQALDAYRKAVAADPGNSEARRGLASALQERGDLEEAIVEYRNLLRIDSNPAAAHFMLGGALQQNGAREQALTHFEAAVELEPGYRMFRFRLAGSLVEAGDLEKAEIQYRSLIERDSRDSSSRLALGEVLVELGRAPEAREQFTAVIGADASGSLHAAAYDNEGRLLARTGDGQAAVEAFEMALEIDPSLVDTRFALANLRGRLGDLSAAAADYRLAVELVPQHMPARLGEATALLLTGSEDEALARLEEGLRAIPGNPMLAHALARILASGSEPALRDGARALEIALALYRESGSLAHGETVAMALGELRRFEEAIDWQENLLAEAERLEDSALISRLAQNLERYRQGQPARIQ